MSDPRRLLDELGELDPNARRALEAARDVEPEPAVQRAVWGALLGRLPPGGGLGGPLGGAAAGGAASGGAVGGTAGAVGSLGLVKALGLGAGAGLIVLVAGQAVVDGSRPTAAPAASAAATARVIASGAPLPEPPRVIPEPRVDPQPEADTVSAPPRGAAGGGNVHVGAVREEARLIAAARQRLLRDDPTAALGLLEQARIRFPDGVLVQEREALAIEALAKSGRNDAAAQRAREFQRAHPESPLKERVRDATR